MRNGHRDGAREPDRRGLVIDAPASASPRFRCPTCSEPHEEHQEYCLECGARLPAVASARDDAPIWAWGAVVTLAMVAIVSGIIVALLASSDGPEVALAVQIPVTTVETIPPSAPPPEPAPVEPAVTVPLEEADAGSGSAEEPLPAGLEEPGADVDPPLTAGDVLPGAPPAAAESSDNPLGIDLPEGPDPTDSAAEPVEISPPPPASPPADTGAWPQGTEGYTIILASIPESRGRSEADSRASAARSAGLDEVRVLLSSSF